MQTCEILQIGQALKMRRLIAEVRERLLPIRPTLSMDTVYRAFNEPEQYTELLDEIRRTGKNILEEKQAIAA